MKEISATLASEYGSPDHGNPEDPLEDLIYLMLSRKTPIAKARQVYSELHRDIGGKWEELLYRGVGYIQCKIYPLGMARQRARDLFGVLNKVTADFEETDLSLLRDWPESRIESYLTDLPGVGTKTARCVMMYTLEPGKFPADAHCIRILSRVGVLPERVRNDHRKAQRYLAGLVPRDIVYDLHVNLVAHGQTTCTTPEPECNECSISCLCDFVGQ